MENTIKEKNENEFWGIVVYDMIGNECLNGIWTNNTVKESQIMNEIARKVKIDDNLDFDGTYLLSWIEPSESKPITGKLIIKKEVDDKTYFIEWINENKTAFYGKGFKLGDKKLVAIYWQAEKVIQFSKNN